MQMRTNGSRQLFLNSHKFAATSPVVNERIVRECTLCKRRKRCREGATSGSFFIAQSTSTWPSEQRSPRILENRRYMFIWSTKSAEIETVDRSWCPSLIARRTGLYFYNFILFSKNICKKLEIFDDSEARNNVPIALQLNLKVVSETTFQGLSNDV